MLLLLLAALQLPLSSSDDAPVGWATRLFSQADSLDCTSQGEDPGPLPCCAGLSARMDPQDFSRTVCVGSAQHIDIPNLDLEVNPGSTDAQAQVKKVWYINLDKQWYRKKKMEEQLQKNNVEFERFAAINVSNQALHWDPKYNEWLKVGASDLLKKNDRPAHAISVWLSQKAIFHKIAESGDSDDLHLMLEDDCILEPGWQQAVARHLKDVPKDWEVVRWGTWNNFRPKDLVQNSVYKANGPSVMYLPDEIQLITKDREPQYHYLGNHAVMTTPKRAKKLVEYLSKTKIFHVDALMVAFDNGLKSYAVQDMHLHPDHDLATVENKRQDSQSAKAYSEKKKGITHDLFLQEFLADRQTSASPHLNHLLQEAQQLE